MSLIKTEKLEKNRVELQIGIDRAALDAEVKKVYAKEIKKMNIPGFRKGKAPLAIVEKLYGKEKIADALLYAKDLKDRYTILWLNYFYFED